MSEKQNEEYPMCSEFEDYLLTNSFIARLPDNKSFVVANDFYINNELYVGED